MLFDCSDLLEGRTGGTQEVKFMVDKTALNMYARYKITYYNKPLPTLDIYGTEYQITDNNGKVFLQLLDESRQPIENASCYSSIYYPNTTVFENDLIMTYIDDGLFMKDVYIPAITGVYMVSAFCDVPNSINITIGDDFECGDLNCNTGDDNWTTSWTIDNAEVTTSDSPRDSYHLKLDGSVIIGGNLGTLELDFKFDETSGTTATDSSYNGNDGTYHNSPNLTITGIDNTAVKLDGINDYVTVPEDSAYNVNSTEDLAICFGINTFGDIANGLGIIDYDDGSVGYEIIGADDEIRFNTDKSGSGAGELLTIEEFTDSEWHTVCFFVNNSVMLAYVDGSYDNEELKDQSGDMNPSGVNMTIGAMDEGANDFLDAGLDEFCIIIGEDLNISGIAYAYNITQTCGGIYGEGQKANATRYFDTTGCSNIGYLTFWAKADAFASDSHCYFDYYNGTDWMTILDYDNVYDDDTYRYNSFEVCSTYGTSSNSGIRVRTENFTSGSTCFIDDIEIILQNEFNETLYQRVRGSGEIHVNDWFTNLTVALQNQSELIGNIWNYTNKTVDASWDEAKFVGGTEYRIGETGKASVQLIKTIAGNPEPVLTATCSVDIYYPNETLIISNANAPYISGSDGIYTYNFTVPGMEGIYVEEFNCTDGPKKYYASGTFHVSRLGNAILEINDSIYLLNTSVINRLDGIENLINNLNNLSASEVWDYYNRTLTDYNQSGIISLINAVNSTIMTKLYSMQDELATILTDLEELYNLTGDVNESIHNRFDTIDTSITNLGTQINNVNSSIMQKLYMMQDEIESVNQTVLASNWSIMQKLYMIQDDLDGLLQNLTVQLANVSNITFNITSDLDNIALRVWEVFFVRGTPPLAPSTEYYCHANDSNVLLKNITYDYKGIYSGYHSKVEEVYCDYGCDTTNNMCYLPPYQRWLVIILISAVLLIIITLLVRRLR
jgi:hypothetical protein